MAEIDVSKLVPPWLALETPSDIDLPKAIKRMKDEAKAAADLDLPPNDNPDGAGHRAAAGLVIAVGNFIYATLGSATGGPLLREANVLLGLYLPPTHGWRWN